MTGPPRWWEAGERTIDDEKARFAAAKQPFTLDEQAFDDGVGIFRGELRRGGETCSATVVYPASYAAGQQPAVYAPDMPITRHKSAGSGLLCLDHTVFGKRAPMTGSEAVARAEELWRLSIEDPEALREQEADAPEPQAENYIFDSDSGAFLFDVDVTGHDEGSICLGATSVQPFRASLKGLMAGSPPNTELPVAAVNSRLRGSAEVPGVWRRVNGPPPGRVAEIVAAWARSHHADLLVEAERWAAIHRGISRFPVPALVGFVFPDEGPRRGEFHDAWLLLLIDPEGTPRLVRAVAFEQHDRWLRQPQLVGLGAKSVGLVGAGALGSQIATLLARAGLGRFNIVDGDSVLAGNLVRHSSSLADVGMTKADAICRQIGLINPYAVCAPRSWTYGAVIGTAVVAELQQLEDNITDAFGDSSLIINATAHDATGYYLSAIGDATEVPVLHSAVSSGAWGGRLLLQRKGRSGCLECLALHQDSPESGSPSIPEWSEDPDLPEVLDRGCAQATFTGPGFELAEAAAAAARCAVQLLLAGKGYPEPDFDLVTLHFRDSTSAEPRAKYSALPRHSACGSCGG